MNVIASEFSHDAGAGSFGYFSFALVGVPLVVGTLVIMVLFGERLLPERTPRSGSRDFSEHARILIEQYGLEGDPELLTRRSGVAEVVVPPRSELIGDTAFPGMVTESGDLVVLGTGAVPPAVAGLLAAGAIVVGRVLTIDEAYRGISWTTVVLVGGMIPLSTAMTDSGAAARLADVLVDVVGSSSPYLLLLGLFVLTAVLGQLISNMATALIVIPVALQTATDLDVSVRPVLMCVTVSAAAALITPVATPANLMVMEPGGYRFSDYWKLGLPLLVLYGIVAVGLVPVFWRF